MRYFEINCIVTPFCCDLYLSYIFIAVIFDVLLHKDFRAQSLLMVLPITVNTLRTGDEFFRLWRFFFATLKDR
jgi:hypothetical protein